MFKDKNKYPFGIAKVDNRLVWAESVNGSLMQYDLDTNEGSVLRQSSAPILDVKLFDPDSQKPAGIFAFQKIWLFCFKCCDGG